MQLVHQHSKSLRNPLAVVWFFIWYRISDRSKRMFVLASLYGQLLQSNGEDDQKLTHVNQHLKLSCCTKALKFPVAISRRVWRNVFPIEKFSLEHKEILVARLVKKTPCWLWYADTHTRHQDIRRLLDYCELQMKAA